MALFRRGGPGLPEPSADGPRDPSLPMLSVEQAAALGALAETAFRAQGLPATYDGAGALHAGAQHFGLHNLATSVAQAPWKKWWPIVDNHARALAHSTKADEQLATAPAEQFQLQLYGEDAVPGVDYDAASPFPGVLALPAIDLPTQVKALLRRDLVDGFGGLDAFRDQALRNLRGLPVPEHTTIRADDERADSDVHVFVGDDFFVASRALVLDELLRQALKVERPAHGCLVALPNRHVLAVHVLEGMGVVTAIKALVAVAEGQFDGPGPIARDVYYLPSGGGPGQRVTERADGELRVLVEGRFADAFQALGLLNG